MNNKLKKILNQDILHIYPKNMKDKKYEDQLVWSYQLWILVPIVATYDLICVIFKIGTQESRAQKISKLKNNIIALIMYYGLFMLCILIILLLSFEKYFI